MIHDERFDRDLGGMLADLAEPRFPDYFNEALQRAMAHRQRPAWTFPERWFPMGVLARRLPLVPALPARMVGILMMLMLLLVATVVIGVGALLLQQRPAPQFGLAANGDFAYTQDGDIYAAMHDGSQARLVIGGPTLDVAPSYSRDGQSLYFIRVVSESPDVVEVMVANADGSGVRALTEPEETSGIHWWTISPRGDVMAMVNDSVSPRFSIISLDDGTRTALDLPNAIQVDQHEWLPSGEEIVLVGRNAAGWAGIFAVATDGTGLRTIVEPQARTYVLSFSISDDGRHLAYGAFHDDSGRLGVWHLVDLATGLDTVQLAPAGQHQLGPVFSSDSSHVAFVRYSDERDGRIDAQVFVAPIDDLAAPVAVGPRQRIPSGTGGLYPQFSPDAAGMVITSDDGHAWLADLPTGEYDELPFGNETGVSWQRRAP